MEVKGAGAGYAYRESSGQKTRTEQTADFFDKMSAARQAREAEAEGETQEENPLSTTEDMMRFIRERKQEICDKVRKGETEVKIRIGAQEYTEKEWKKLMESFDEAQDELRELLKEEWERHRKAWEQQKEREEEADEEALQEELLEKLFEDR